MNGAVGELDALGRHLGHARARADVDAELIAQVAAVASAMRSGSAGRMRGAASISVIFRSLSGTMRSSP